MTDYQGPERRVDDVRVRLAVLESAHMETKQSIDAVYKRISENRVAFAQDLKDLAMDIRSGLREVIGKMELQEHDRVEQAKEREKEKAKDCSDCKKDIDGRVGSLERDRNIVAGAWALLMIVLGWIGIRPK